MNEKNAALSRVVGVEEHVVMPELINRLPEDKLIERGFLARDQPFGKASLFDKCSDTEDRLKDLDAAGVTVQILSYPLAGADLLPPRQGILWAKDVNEATARHVAAHPDRYAGLAHLPLTDPGASADELQFAVEQFGFKGAMVNGMTEGRRLRHRLPNCEKTNTDRLHDDLHEVNQVAQQTTESQSGNSSVLTSMRESSAARSYRHLPRARGAWVVQMVQPHA